MGLLAALQFLTIIPVKRGFTTDQVAGATGYFPAVGVIVGIILAALSWLLRLLLPSSVVNVLVVVSLAVLSGGLHLDGLVDTCDGLAGHGTPEQRWRAMHDSRAGGFGIIGAALLLLVKFVSLNSLPQSLMIFTLLIAPVISRWAMVYALFAHPYARPSGLGKTFKQATGRRQFVMATLITVAFAVGLFKLAGLFTLSIIWLLIMALAICLKRKLAGLTGDTYGAINEVAESSVFIFVSLLAYQHWLI